MSASRFAGFSMNCKVDTLSLYPPYMKFNFLKYNLCSYCILESKPSDLEPWNPNLQIWIWSLGIQTFRFGALESKPSDLEPWNPNLQIWSLGIQTFRFGALESKPSDLEPWNPNLQIWSLGVQTFRFGRD